MTRQTRPSLVRLAWWLLAAALSLAPNDATAQITPPLSANAIVQVAENLFTATDGRRTTMFLVTPRGIILADALTPGFARWLKQELASRFPGQPVRHIVMGHYVPERVAAAEEFKDTAEVVTHWSHATEMRKAHRVLPASLAPAAFYSGQGSLFLGGATVNLVNIPMKSAPATTVLWFAREGILFVMDAPWIERGPQTFEPFGARDTLLWFRSVDALPFGYLFTGLGETVSKQRLSEMRNQVETDLDQAVAARAVAGFAGAVKVLRAETFAAGVADALVPTEHCRGFTTCESGGWAESALVGLRLSYGSIGGVVESRFGASQQAERIAPQYGDLMAFRTVQFSWLVRFTPPPLKSMRVALVGGPSSVHGDTQAVLYARNSASARTSVTYHSQGGRLGWTVGADLMKQVGARWQLFVPARFTFAPGDDLVTWLGTRTVQVGLGIAMTPYDHGFLR